MQLNREKDEKKELNRELDNFAKVGYDKLVITLSLQKIKELKGIKKKDKKVRIGAIATAQEIISNSLINKYIPALADAARSI